jgi:hypothetical protein
MPGMVNGTGTPVVALPPRSAVRRLRPARRLDGEKLALSAAAVAVAMLPLAVPTGPANTAPIDALVALAFVACLLWAARTGLRLRFPYVVPVAMMLIGGALGALMGPVPIKGAVALFQDVVLIGWCWALVNISRSPRHLKVLLTTWVYSGVAWALVAFVGLATGSSMLTGQVEHQGSRVQITLADPSYAANYLFISIMIMWATQRPRHRAVRMGAYLLLVAAIATTGSNSGIVGLIAGTLIATVLGAYRRFGVVPAVTVLAFIVLSGSVVASNIRLSEVQEKAHESPFPFLRDGIGRSNQSSGQREALVKESLHLYERGSPLGEGPVSTKTRLSNENVLLVKEAHDDYFAALIERGPLGFLGIIVLVTSVMFRALSVVRARLDGGFAGVVVNPNALVGALAGTLIAMTVYELLHVRHVWALFAVVASLSIWAVKR